MKAKRAIRWLVLSGGAALLLPLAGCLDLPTGGPGGCSVTDASVNWRITYQGNSSRLVDANARPEVEGLLTVGSQLLVEVLTIDVPLCISSQILVTWHLTNRDAASIDGSQLGLLRAIAPGHTQITATVVYRGRSSEATLFWCQNPPGDGPFTRDQCTWIPMSGVRVVP